MIYISFDIGVKNLALCIIKKNDIADTQNTLEIIDWRIIALADSKKEIKGIEDITERIYMNMDNIVGDLKSKNINTIDYVLIENQPSNLNGIMKTIQHIIYGYFSLIKFWDKEVGNVILINASLKTKHHNYVINIANTKPDELKNKKGFRKDKYKNNKLLSIELCKQYISEDEYLKKLFNENKKKDDLSDACLQAISYIRSTTKEDITNKYNKIYSSRIGNNEKEEVS
jgi:hypothetical protein